jgi:hypothetical protein
MRVCEGTSSSSGSHTGQVCSRVQQAHTRSHLFQVLDSVLEGNPGAMLPGEVEARAARRSEHNGGLLFSRREVAELADVASSAGVAFDATALKTALS